MTEIWSGWPFFTKKEMRCRCGCEGLPQDSFMKKLVTARQDAAFPFVITSGFRCAEYNRQVSTSGDNSPHVLGLAADVQIYGERAFNIVDLGILHGMTGIGVSQKGELAKRFIHLDSVKTEDGIERPRIWSY